MEHVRHQAELTAPRNHCAGKQTKFPSPIQNNRTTQATVLLNANVGFLPKESGTGTSPQQFLSYMSLVASMASIILGLVFMGHSRTEARNTPFEVVSTSYFLHNYEVSDLNRPHSCIDYGTKGMVLRPLPSFIAYRMLSSCGGECPGCCRRSVSLSTFFQHVPFLCSFCSSVVLSRQYDVTG